MANRGTSMSKVADWIGVSAPLLDVEITEVSNIEGAAVFILAAIAQWRQELMDQVPVGGVNLQHLKAGGQRPFGRGAEGIHHRLNPGLG